MSPKKTALYPVHEKLGAAFTDFGGWDMPLKYATMLPSMRLCAPAPVSLTSPIWASSV